MQETPAKLVAMTTHKITHGT